MRASVTLFRNLQHLGNYCILNYTGFVKICKKHDKSVAAELRLWAPHLEAELETLAFVTQSGLGTLLRQLEAAHANPNPNPNPHPNPSPNPNPNPNQVKGDPGTCECADGWVGPKCMSQART